jgi:hypothetical protein
LDAALKQTLTRAWTLHRFRTHAHVRFGSKAEMLITSRRDACLVP